MEVCTQECLILIFIITMAMIRIFMFEIYIAYASTGSFNNYF